MSLTPERMKELLGDLGKPTMRGVRRCPKCGTLNGTRGISCKNKDCDVVFKEKDKKKGHSADAVKIITGSSVQVFSVRLRDRGPDYRGFVQLPLVQDLDGNPAENVDPEVLAQAARCYVDACIRNSNVAVHNPNTACSHIKAAISCNLEAQPLTLKNSVLNSLQVGNDIKQAIWLLATETTGPLVQRVTKNIMVVKCKANSKQLLGFLHFAFFETKKSNGVAEYRFQCSCKSNKNLKPGQIKEESGEKRCVHFYACICAFASDEALSEEFHYYINLDNSLANFDNGLLVTVEEVDLEDRLAPDECMTVTATEAEALAAAEGNVEIVHIVEEMVEQAQVAEEEEEAIISDTLAQASSALLTLQESAKQHQSPQQHSLKKPSSPIRQIQRPSPVKRPASAVDESSSTISFYQWLGSVTERVNETMHYQFDGTPDPLVFHAPQTFFDCLQQRISAGHKKKRLPNSTTGFVRKDALPLGTFTKYTWHITNILHVKQIFDTPDMPLDITRSFVENRDGTYDLYEHKIDENSARPQGTKPIRPFELKTYLKVGNTAPDQKEPTPFIIEWIPDILPKSHIGELRVKFEYGHQRNGHVEKRTGPLPLAPALPQVPPTKGLELAAYAPNE